MASDDQSTIFLASGQKKGVKSISAYSRANERCLSV